MKTNKNYGKIMNPHTKQNLKQPSKMDQDSKHHLENEMLKEQNLRSEQKQQKSTIDDPNSFSKELLQKGFIEAYIDYFYIYSKTTPNIKAKYEKEDQNINSNVGELRIMVCEYDTRQLREFMILLSDAESYLRSGRISEAIHKYLEVKEKCFSNNKDLINAIYFNQKCITLAKNHNMINLLIKSLISIGSCFDGTNNYNDLILSVNFKEEAKKLFKQLSQLDKDPSTESDIYTALMSVYKELASQQESQNNYSKAIEYLTKQLENIANLEELLKQGGPLEKDKMEVFIKIASLNFKMKNYKETIEYLDILRKEFSTKFKDKDNQQNNVYKMKGYLLYAETLEIMGDYKQAIEYLKEVKPIDLTTLNPEESQIYTKSLLHLGRLYYMNNDTKQSHENLTTFFKESKKLDTKELLDLSRVNLGMIKGQMAFENFKKLLNESSFLNFVGMKLKYHADS